MANSVFKVDNGLAVIGTATVENLTISGTLNLTDPNQQITITGTTNGNLIPVNNTFSLGNTTNIWTMYGSNVYLTDTAVLNVATFAGISTHNATTRPNANNVKLGDTDKRWDLYANNANVLSVGVSGTTTTANLVVSGVANVVQLTVNPGLANAVVVAGNTTHTNVTISSNSTQFFSNVIFDTNLLFVDAVNNRVGISTLTPDAGFTVAATANVSGAVVLGSTLAVNGALTVSNNGVFTGTVNASAGFNAGANVLVSTSDIKVGNATVNSFVNSSSISTTGTLSVTANASFSNNVTISGNLTVSGTTTYVNTSTLNVADNIVTLNADVGGATAPTENAGIEVNRGSSANVTVRWNETSDIWDLTEDGINFYQVVNRNQAANATYAGILTVLDSVTNTSITIAASANSVKRAYDIASTAYSNAISVSSSDATTKAGTAYSNAVAFSANASNISSGTLATARLPATANISTAINVGANVNLSTTAINVGNATVNTVITSSTIVAPGTVAVGNTTITGFLNVSSYGTFGGAVNAASLNISGVSVLTGNATFSNVITVAGISTFNSNVAINTGSLELTDGSLTVNGNITTTGYVDASSDARIKTNVRPITNALNTVLNIEGVVYDRIDVDLKDQMGFIAQQIKPYVPEIVNGTEEGGYRVSYQNIVALLVEAIKDLNNKLEELQKRG